MTPKTGEILDLYEQLPDNKKWLMFAALDIIMNGPVEDKQQLEKLSLEPIDEVWFERVEEHLSKHKDWALEQLQ